MHKKLIYELIHDNMLHPLYLTIYIYYLSRNPIKIELSVNKTLMKWYEIASRLKKSTTFDRKFLLFASFLHSYL